MSGEGRPQAGYPRIAAQPEAYLVRQLEAYADGRRSSAVMEPLARSLTAGERSRLAAHFAATDPKATPSAQSYSKRGETLAVSGDNALRVQACQNCHGPLGRGQAPHGASLAGLAPGYLRAEMHAWRSGTRRSDPSGQMPVIAGLLTEADTEAVVLYYAGLPVPSPLRPQPLPRYQRTQPPTLEGVGQGPGKASASQGPAGSEAAQPGGNR
jgi:cytochrome c553